LCGVTVAETLLVYVAAPLLVVAVLAALTMRPDPKARRRRYRPGQPWEHEPLWYAPYSGQPAAGHGSDTAAQPHGRTGALGSSVYGEVQGGPAAGGPHLSLGEARAEAHGSPDGARGSHGATAVGAGAPVVGRGGPLGGARGTW
jgi:hypothetical protein